MLFLIWQRKKIFLHKELKSFLENQKYLDSKEKNKVLNYLKTKKPFKENLINLFYITCFSKKYNIDLIWSHYAKYHQGVCFEFNNINDNSLHECKYDSIYNKDLLDISSFYFKKKEWSYEREVRIVKDASLGIHLSALMKARSLILDDKITITNKKIFIEKIEKHINELKVKNEDLLYFKNFKISSVILGVNFFNALNRGDYESINNPPCDSYKNEYHDLYFDGTPIPCHKIIDIYKYYKHIGFVKLLFDNKIKVYGCDYDKHGKLYKKIFTQEDFQKQINKLPNYTVQSNIDTYRMIWGKN